LLTPTILNVKASVTSTGQTTSGGEIMGRFEVAASICSNCGHKLIRGFRRFGPAEVRCGCCGTLLQTGLGDWCAPFPFVGRGGRAGVAAAELLNPSWIGVPGPMGFVIHLAAVTPMAILTLGMVGMVPLIVLKSLYPATASVPDGSVRILAMTLVGLGTLSATLGFLAYPLSLVRRLIRMVRENRIFHATKEPPTWNEAAEAPINWCH
jgi:hypothetical protein